MVLGEETFSQGVRKMALSLATNMIEAILEMGERWVATQIMMMIVGSTTADEIIAGHAGEAYAAAFAATAAFSAVAAAGRLAAVADQPHAGAGAGGHRRAGPPGQH